MEAVLFNGASELFTCPTPVLNLLFSIINNEKILFSSSESNVLIHSFGSSDFLRRKTLTSYEEISCSKKPIIDIVMLEQRLFIVDETGAIYNLTSGKQVDVFEESMNDLFSDDDGATKWQFHDHAIVPCEKVLAMCSTSLGLCVLGFDGHKLALHSLSDKGDTFTVDLCQNNAKVASLNVVSSRTVCENFQKHWALPEDPCEQYVFVTVDDSVFCYPVHRNAKAKLIYKSVHMIVCSHWYHDPDSKSFTSFNLLLQNGCLVRLHPFGEDVKFVLSSFTSVGFLSNSHMISCNGFEMSVVYLNDNINASDEEFEPVSIPIPGVLSIISSAKQNEIIISTDSNKVYAIDLNIIRIEKKSSKSDGMDKLTDLNNLIIQAKYLSDLNDKIKKGDEALKAASLAARSDILSEHFNFSAKVIQGLGNKYSFRVKITFSVPGVTFSKDSWALSMTLKSMNKSIHETFNLRENLSCEKDYVRLLTLSVEFDLLYVMSCELTMYSDATNRSFKIPVGKLEVDCSYFFVPVSLGDLMNEGEAWSSGLHSLNLSLPLLASPLKTLLKNSMALWRSSEWSMNTEGKEAAFLVFGSKVLLRLDGSTLNITSTSLKACFAVKIAAVRLLLPQQKELESQLMLELTGWYQAENVLQFGASKQELLLELNRLLDSSRYSVT